MGTQTTCDGNGTPIPADTPTTGAFGRQYCDELRPVAEAYLADVDALHTKTAEAFIAQLKDIRSLYADKLRELPDAP